MSDDIKFNDEFFADNEPVEKKVRPKLPDKENLSPEMLIKIIIAAVAVGAVIIIVLGCLVFASFNKDDNGDNSGEGTTVSSVEDEKTAGRYTIKIEGGGSLRLRETPSMEASELDKVPNGTTVIVVSVETVDGVVWGKTSYNNKDGYVDMKYLANVYSGSEVTPEATTKAPEQGSEEAEKTTVPSSSETTTAKPAEPSSSATNVAGSPSTPGTYTVDAQPALNLRDGHSVNALSIAKIPDKETITITEVYYDKSSDDSYTAYWGKTTYQGITGWVAMGYLE